MADVRIQQYPQKSIVSDNDIFLIADSNDVDVNGFLKYKKVRAKDLPSIVNTAESITYANLIASIAADDLIIGTFYKITDSTSGVSPLLVQAVGVDAIGYLAFDGTNPLVTINYDVITDTIRWSLNQTVAPISLGSLSATTPLSYNNTTGVFTISQSNTSTNGFLSSADWNTFTAKQNALSGTGIVKSTGGTISYLTDNSTNWNTAYNDSIVSAGVTGTSTKTLTLNQQDGGTVTASWSDADTGLTSVGLTMPSAFSVANSPLTSNGTLAVTGAGVASQYVRGDGTLAAFPTSTGGGSSVSYYFNGGTNQGTIGGNTYYEMSETAVIGTGADFNINANGYIAQFVTDANDPALLSIPAGNWNFEMWFSASSGGGSPSFYLELYKYDGATLTLISSGSAVPESITGGTAIDLYTTALAVPTTALTITDRLAVRVFVNNSSRTITLHTQNGHLCQAITTFSTGLTALNGLTNQVQYLAVGTSGTDFAISSATSTHTFNLPTASAANRGALSSADWTTFNNKQNALTNPITGTGTTNYLPKFTGASALGDSIFSDISGVATIAGNLSVAKSDGVNDVYMKVQQLANFTAAGIPIVANNDGGAGYNFIYSATNGGTEHWRIGGNGATSTLAINTAGSERMRITSAGNLLIGTTTDAGYKLDVNGTARVGAFTAAKGIFQSSTGETLTAQGTAGNWVANLSGSASTSNSYGLLVEAGTNSSDLALGIYSKSFAATLLTIKGDGAATFSSSVTTGGDIDIIKSGGANLGIKTTNDTTPYFQLNRNNGAHFFGAFVLNTGATFFENNNGTILSLGSTGAATFSSSVTATSFGGNAYPYNSILGGGADASTSTVFAGSTSGYASSIDVAGGGAANPNTIIFKTASTERMRITSSGNVGIGITTPSGKLHIKGNAADWNLFGEASDGSQLYGIYEDAGAGQLQIMDASGTAQINFQTRAGQYNFINNSFGIGTTTDAGYKLDVNGDARATTLTANGNGTFGSGRKNNQDGTSVVSIFGSSTSVPSAQLNLTQVWNTLEYPVVLENIYNSAAGPASSLFVLSTTQFSGSAPLKTERLRIDGNTGVSTFASSVTMGGELLISTGADSGMRLKAGVSSLSYIDFADANTGAPQGSIAYNHIVDALVFSAGGSNAEKMRVKSNTINFSSLPTSSAGLSAGDIWNDSGTLKIV